MIQESKIVRGNYSVEELLKKYKKNITDEIEFITKFGMLNTKDWSYIIICYVIENEDNCFKLVKYSGSSAFAICKNILGFDFKKKAKASRLSKLRLLIEYEKAYSNNGLSYYNRTIINKKDEKIEDIIEKYGLSVRNTKFKNNNRALIIGNKLKYITLIFRVKPNTYVVAMYTFTEKSVYHIITNLLGYNFNENIDRVKNEKVKLLINVITCLNNPELK
ncbi:hypothetical protein QEW_4457 [Clostridioides difficile CD160]|nr:hypothetical protein QEW_4457 [Clostridioides difficile CD160]